MKSTVVSKGLGFVFALLSIYLFSEEASSPSHAIQQGAMLAVLGYVAGYVLGQIGIVIVFFRQESYKRTPKKDDENESFKGVKPGQTKREKNFRLYDN